jgi:quercetin dioxygenase-like cupin family protein
MILHRHQDLEGASPAPGLSRIISMDQSLGSGAITQGMVTTEPGRQSRPHTHRVEEAMTLLEGRLRVLIGSEGVAEVDAPATFLAPANTVHALRNVGATPAVLWYPSMNVGPYFVDGSTTSVGPAPRALASGGAGRQTRSGPAPRAGSRARRSRS